MGPTAESGAPSERSAVEAAECAACIQLPHAAPLHDAGAFCLPAALLEPEKEDLRGAGAKGPLDEAAPLVLVEELIEQVVDVAVDSSGLFPEDICAVRQCKVHGGAVAG